MLRNSIIVIASIAVIGWNVYVFRNWKKLNFTKKNFAIGFFIMWFFSTFLFNISVILSPLTPTINGTVIDSETKLPIATCNIKAYWEIESGTPGGRNLDTYHQFITKTDEKGRFKVPRYMKALALHGLFPILGSRYAGVMIVAYTHGFKFSFGGVEPCSSVPTIIEPLQPAIVSEVISMYKGPPAYIMDDIFGLEEIFRNNNIPRGTTTDDMKYILDDYNYYYERFDEIFNKLTNKERESALIQFASAFKRLGNTYLAINVYRRLLKEFPESSNFANQEIDQIRRNVQ